MTPSSRTSCPSSRKANAASTSAPAIPRPTSHRNPETSDIFSSWWRAFLEAVFPFFCHLCRQPADWGSVLCQSCADLLNREVRTPFQVTDLHCDCPVFTLGFYEGTLASAIKTGKYRPSRKLFRHLARLAGERVGKPWPGVRPEVVIPVPLHSSREESRGFNQAAMVGRELAKAVGAHFSPALCRTRATRPQAGCDELERASNLHGAFSLAPGLAPGAFRERRLCLVDDVATTGATLEECRKALLPLNPAAISVLTLAHAPRRIPVTGPERSGLEGKSGSAPNGTKISHQERILAADKRG